MATITSTIRLVDQMTPTLNKISKAIDRVNTQSKSIGSAKTWSGFNTGVRTATKSTHSLYSTLRRVAYVLGTLRGLQGIATITDTMISANARIDNINDGLYKTSDYMDIIYQAAQRSRGSFMGMAQSVGKLGTVAGDAFNSVSEMVAFTELMNKLFVISGSSATEASSAMYQLTQAMAAGRLQGDEMRSILENAPLLAQKLADYLGVTKGEIKELGAEGVITADIIKAALFGAADEINDKFEDMPKTIGQIWTEIKNHALNSFRPVIERIQQFINSPIFEKFKNRIFAIIDAISNALLRLFAAFETPRVQNALDKVYTAMQTLWGIVVDVARVMANAAIWIADNWSWLSQIIYGVIAVILFYKAVMLIVAAAHIVTQAKMAIASWVAALIAGEAWAWVLLIVIALIATVFLAVNAFNYFTGSSVSALGVLFGAVAFVIAGVVALIKTIIQGTIDLVQTIAIGIVNVSAFIINLASAVLATIVLIGWKLLETAGWVIETIFVLGWNLLTWVMNLITALGSAIGQIIANIGGTFLWLLDCMGTALMNCITIVANAVAIIGAYWTLMSSNAKIWFIDMCLGLIDSVNSMISGTNDGVKEMIKPIADFVDKCIAAWNSVATAWNNTIGSLGVSETFSVFGKEFSIDIQMPKLKTYDGLFSDSITGGNSITSSLASGKLDALADRTAAQGIINRGLFNGVQSFSNYSDYADWGSVGDAWGKGWKTFEYADLPDYNVNWQEAFDGIESAFKIVDYLDMSGIWEGSKYASFWSDAWDVAKEWYDKGASIENGIAGLVDGIGGLLEGLFGKGENGTGSSALDKVLHGNMGDTLSAGEGTGSPNLPSSLEDLLNGSSPGGGISDALGSIADNTGSSAGSASNIEDTLDLAEEELELLRKLAEQEVINRFTTAEIHVDMTNNNNISSGMDLDGIVTHLSTKLYEELGVVASGVHY